MTQSNAFNEIVSETFKIIASRIAQESKLKDEFNG